MVSNENIEFFSRRKIELSRHAKQRGKQRAISPECAELIILFGERSHDGRGGIRCLMTDHSMARLTRAVGHSQRGDSLAGCYVVLSAEDESRVITMGHCYG